MGKITAALCAAILGMTSLTAPAQAADDPVLFNTPFDGIWWDTTQIKFRGPAAGKCLDAALEELDRDGGKVQLWTCGSGDEQRWNVVRHPSGSGSEIVNVANGKCLDAALEKLEEEVTPLSLWECSGGVEQRWSVGYHSGDLFVTHVHKSSDRFGVPSVYDGAPLSLYAWN